uniref:Calpain catalytic domain-containing protein n=1 Tax=Xiphophorus couchianus TaxID=32473 RepID=A0A3B5MCQ9_9TELE
QSLEISQPTSCCQPGSVSMVLQKEHGYGTSQNPDRFQQQDYLQLKRFLLTQNKLFRDEMFPPDQHSIGQGKLEPAELAQVQWLRPRACDPSVTSCLFSGNCWFLASLGALTFHKEIFKLIVPLDQTCVGKDYCGLFHFRFWRFGKWVDVVIDDKLPTIKRKPIFARSKDEREFWPALLEKAYAKYSPSFCLFCRNLYRAVGWEKRHAVQVRGKKAPGQISLPD